MCFLQGYLDARIGNGNREFSAPAASPCRAWQHASVDDALLHDAGEPNDGLKCMFTMMNAMRIEASVVHGFRVKSAGPMFFLCAWV